MEKKNDSEPLKNFWKKKNGRENCFELNRTWTRDSWFCCTRTCSSPKVLGSSPGPVKVVFSHSSQKIQLTCLEKKSFWSFLLLFFFPIIICTLRYIYMLYAFLVDHCNNRWYDICTLSGERVRLRQIKTKCLFKQKQGKKTQLGDYALTYSKIWKQKMKIFPWLLLLIQRSGNHCHLLCFHSNSQPQIVHHDSYTARSGKLVARWTSATSCLRTKSKKGLNNSKNKKAIGSNMYLHEQ